MGVGWVREDLQSEVTLQDGVGPPQHNYHLLEFHDHIDIDLLRRARSKRLSAGESWERAQPLLSIFGALLPCVYRG